MNETPVNKILEDYLDDESVIALSLAVTYWGLTNQNPNTTPAGIGQVLETANKFKHYLDGAH